VPGRAPGYGTGIGTVPASPSTPSAPTPTAPTTPPTTPDTATPPANPPASTRPDVPPPSPPSRPAAAAGSLAGSATAPRVTSTPPPAAAEPTRRGTRRARLQVRRVDPWSVLRFSFISALALFVVFLVAVAVLYGVLSAMGVFSTVNEQLESVTGTGGPDPTGGFQLNFSFARIFGYAVLIGIVNTVLITALATLGAFVYNLVADLVGGIEVVLAERE
jgi:hypothetical protein